MLSLICWIEPAPKTRDSLRHCKVFYFARVPFAWSSRNLIRSRAILRQVRSCSLSLMCEVAFHNLRQSSNHVVMRACRYSSYWLRALVAAPSDGGEVGRLNCASDWALASPQLSRNANAQTLSTVRMTHQYYTAARGGAVRYLLFLRPLRRLPHREKTPGQGQQIPDGRSSSPVYIGFCVRCRRSGSPWASVTSPVLGARAVVRRGTPRIVYSCACTAQNDRSRSTAKPLAPTSASRRCRRTIDSASPVLVAASPSARKRSTIWSRLRQHKRADVSGTSWQKPEP